jgi:methionyl-tRNA formyltransferase
LRIALIGQAVFGEKVLEALLKNGAEVVAVFCPPDAPGKPGPLPILARARGVPVHQPRRMKDPAVSAAFEQLKPDLNVMAFVTDIVPLAILVMPRLGTIQYHPSLLPRHRGGSAINWAIIQGDRETGLTVFWPDSGIDTGPILLQKSVCIGPDDTTGSLYFNKLFPLGVEAMVEAVALVDKGMAPRIPQDELRATSEPLCTEALTAIDWRRPAATVYDLIRGANPSPGAWTTFQDKRLKLFDAQLLEASGETLPGTVVAVEAEGFLVACRGGSILVKRVQEAGMPKVKASEFALTAGLVPGDRLGAEE